MASETTTKATPEIIRRKDGWFLPDNLALEWTDGKTDDEMRHDVADFESGDGILWAILFGLKQGSADSYAGKGVTDAAARVKRNEKLGRIFKGTLGTGGGGKKADVVAREAVATILLESGGTAKGFKDAYGTGRDAVTAYVTHAVAVQVEALAVGDRPDAETVLKIIEANEARIYVAAKAAIALRSKGGATKIKMAI